VAATLTRDGELAQTWINFPIEKIEEDADGDLYVWGKATDGSVDSDEQIIDPDFSARALNEWLGTGGNVRVQHQAQRDPAGKGVQIETSPEGHYVKSLIVEPVAKRLVAKGVLTAYSVGIARPTIVRDGVARGGRITDGHIVELSLVDRPANKNCGIQLVKAAADGTAEFVSKVWGAEGVLEKMEDDIVNVSLPSDVSVSFTPGDLAKVLAARTSKSAHVEKKDFDRNVGGGVDRDKISSGDFAGRDRSFPIVTAGDVSDALQSIGRAGSDNYDAATLRSNILRIARRKGFPVPDSAKKPKKNKSMDEIKALKDEIEALKAGKVDPDHDGDNDATAAGDTDHDYWDKDGKQKKPLPGKAMRGDDHDDDDDDDTDSDDEDQDAMGKSAFPAEVITAMRYKSVGVPHELGMLHAFTCPAFDPDEVQKCHPGGGLNTLDEGYWQRQAIDMASGGSLEAAKGLSILWGHAQALKSADQSDIFVLRQQLHKAFQDANPGPGHAPVPSGQPHPGSYNRPFISAGHSAASSGQEGPNSAKVPTDSLSASQFGRGPITSGHADPSPGYSNDRNGVSGPSQTGQLTPSNFGNVPRSNLQQALDAMHTHVAQTFPDLCPMKPEDANSMRGNPVPTPGSTPSASAAKGDPESKDEISEKSIPQEGKPKKGKKLPPVSGPPNMGHADEVAAPDLEKAVTSAMEKMLASVPQAEQPTPVTQEDIQASVKDVLYEMLREEPVTQADVKKAVTVAVKKAVAAQAEKAPQADDIRAVIKAAIEEAQSRPEPVTPADIQKAISAAVEAAREPVEPPVTQADLKKAISSAVKKAVAAVPVLEPVAPAPAIDQTIIAEITGPMMARLEAQGEMLRRQQKQLRKAKLDAPTAQQPMPDMETMLARMEAAAVAQAQAHAQGQSPVAQPGLTRDDLATFTQPLFERLEVQERLIRKQEKRLEKAQMRAFMEDTSRVAEPPPPADNTREIITELTAQLQSQPGVSEEIIKQVTAPLMARLEAQEQMIQERLDDSVLSKEHGSEVAKDAMREVTGPLLARLEAQEQSLRRQQKQLRKAQQQRENEMSIAALREQMLSSAGPQPRVTSLTKSASLSELSVPLLERMKSQEKLIRKQQKQLSKQQEQLNSLPEIAKAVDAMAGLPDPSMAPFKGIANNIFKSAQAPAHPVGAQGVADVAERTQAMMLRELEEQFRTTSDSAQREAAWKTIIKMRGLPEGTNPY
jgi:hypothetical protein